jgi:hypothetical protein
MKRKLLRAAVFPLIPLVLCAPFVLERLFPISREGLGAVLVEDDPVPLALPGVSLPAEQQSSPAHRLYLQAWSVLFQINVLESGLLSPEERSDLFQRELLADLDGRWPALEPSGLSPVYSGEPPLTMRVRLSGGAFPELVPVVYAAGEDGEPVLFFDFEQDTWLERPGDGPETPP